MSRAGSGIEVGSISLHPAGFVHGPQPGSRERSESQDRTSELAVMLGTVAPLGLTQVAAMSAIPTPRVRGPVEALSSRGVKAVRL